MVGYGAPPVVAVVVTSDPGDWFEDAIESLAGSGYENLSVLVLDNASNEDPTARIASVFPSAFVKRVDADRGFSAAANEVLHAVEGAAFYMILHDDVILEPGAITELVAEAFRSNAGIVGPKLLDWDRPDEILSVGLNVDPYGFSSSISEPGELDQQQHDIPREVFAISNAAMLIRADLFDSLGGFNEDIPFFGEDIDLCWRAHAAGATVTLCPSANALHRGRFDERRDVGNRRRLELRHEARNMLSNYELLRLLWVVPVAFMLSVVDLVGSIVMGRFQRAGDIAGAWFWNIGHIGSLMKSRSRAKRTRRARDRDYLPLMRQGSSRLKSLVRVAEGENRLQVLAQTGRGYLRDAASRSRRGGLVVLIVSIVVMLYGARNLIFGPLPVLREFSGVGSSGGRLLSEWFTGWREAGLGEPGVAPGIIPALGGIGTVLLGSVGFARRLLILLPLLIGGVGAWKLFSRSDSTAARAAMLASYGLNPLVLNAMAEGRLQALAVYAAAPWLLRRVAGSANVEPFVDRDAPAPDRPRLLGGTAILLAAVGSITLLGAGILLLMVLVFAAVVTTLGDRRSGSRMALTVITSAALSLPVLAPWIVAAIRHGDLASLTGLWNTSTAVPSAQTIITGSTGAVTTGIVGWGLLIGASFGLFAGRKWRFNWAVGGWLLALISWLVAIVLARSGNVGGAGIELLAMPAVLGMAIAIAMGVFAFDNDVLGSDFGLEQLLSGVAVAAFVIGLIPVGIASTDGRWFQPERDFRSALSAVDHGDDFRTIWIGDPDVLPLAGWNLDGQGLVAGVSVGLDPTITSRFRLDGGVGVDALTRSLNAALHGETNRLGRLLGPMGVRYVVVADRAAPLPDSKSQVPMPEDLLSALDQQLDMHPISVNPGLALYATDSPWPLRSDATTELDTATAPRTFAELIAVDLPIPPPVLGARAGTKFSGNLPGDRLIAQATTADPGWKLTVEGKEQTRSDIWGWAQTFETGSGGASTLSYSPPLSTRLLQLIQILGLLALLYLGLFRGTKSIKGLVRRSRSEAGDTGSVVGADGESTLVTVGPVGLVESRTTAETAGEAAEGATAEGATAEGATIEPPQEASVDPNAHSAGDSVADAGPSGETDGSEL
ncbi:MAG: glycosyltransferase [Microthrixaceae bacterium]